jgi:hypothetical protein
MSDSYVTPSKRNNENRVYSFKSARDSCESKSELDLEKEYFPSLGNNSNVSVESSDENMISFASSLTTEIPKKKVIKEVEDGWMCIRKDKQPKFLFGELNTEKSKEDYKVINEIRRYYRDNGIYRTLENYERYEKEDEIRYGPTTIHGWEVGNYLEEVEMNKKYERLEAEFIEGNEENNDAELS